MPRPHFALLPFIGLSLAVSGCGAAGGVVTAVNAGRLARWTAAAHARRVVDLSDPLPNGNIVVAAAGHLALLGSAGSSAQPYATGPVGYASAGGEEPYIALAPRFRHGRAGCSFGTGTLYALRLVRGPGVTAIDSRGRARAFVSLGGRGLEDGIAFDETGRFGHRLLVTATAGPRTSVWAIDCRGAVGSITRSAPRLEGGIAVAPASFGRYAGDLIAPDENSGRVYAIAPDGRTRLVAASGLPRGGDVGVESLGFVPSRFGPQGSALVADRRTPGNPHPGDDTVLRIGGDSLIAAGLRGGDLLVATEGGARTDAITCTTSCHVRHVADGPSAAHLEGHIVFTSSP